MARAPRSHIKPAGAMRVEKIVPKKLQVTPRRQAAISQRLFLVSTTQPKQLALVALFR
jgi:hypothetical protein